MKIHGEVLTISNIDGDCVLLLWLKEGAKEIIAKPEIVEQLKQLGLTNPHDYFVFDGKIRQYDELEDADLDVERMYYKLFKTMFEQGHENISKEDAFKRMHEQEERIIRISNYRDIPIILEEENDKSN